MNSIVSQLTEYFNYGYRLVIADELDYLITRDRAVLHDLFMLTTLPFSKCILLGMLKDLTRLKIQGHSP